MQLIFLFETNKTSKSDYKYVRSYLLNTGMDRKFKFSPLYLNGKGNYDKFENKINSLIKDYQGISKVFMFIDVDSISLNYDQAKLNKDIINYCKEKDFEIIWFKRTIEEVFWGEKTPQNKKNTKADEFLRKNIITKIDYSILNKETYDTLKNGESNLKFVFDKFINL